MLKKVEEEKAVLSKEELSVLSQVLFRSKWNGREWEDVVRPLINKLAKMAKMIDDLPKKE